MLYSKWNETNLAKKSPEISDKMQSEMLNFSHAIKDQILILFHLHEPYCPGKKYILFNEKN